MMNTLNTAILGHGAGVLALTASLAVGACSSATGSEPGVDSRLTSAAEPAAPPAVGEGLTARSVSTQISWQRWSKGDPPLNLKPWRTHVCAFGMIRGDFEMNTGSPTGLQIAPVGDNWVLRGTNAAGNLLQADALCLPLSVFHVNSGTATLGQVTAAGLNAGVKNTTSTTVMTRNTAPVLTNITGQLNGFGEEMWVDVNTPSLNVKNGTAPGVHSAGAYPLSFGGQRMPFYGDGIYLEQSETVFSACEPDCPPPTPIDEAFCFIHMVAGKLRGAEEWAQIYPDFASGTWKASVHAGSGSSIKAQIECLEIEQRVANPPPIH